MADIEGDRGSLVEVMKKSPDRVQPECRHFGICGGCALQHFDEKAAAAWKTAQIAEALDDYGIKTRILPVACFPGQGRRRAVFAARRTKKTVLPGFHARRSDQIIAVDDCRVLHPEISSMLPELAELLKPGLTRRGEASVRVLWTPVGGDIAVDGGRDCDMRLSEHLAFQAQRLDLARLVWNGELVVERRTPYLQFGPARVSPPPGGFVQALAAAEARLASFVLEGLKDSGNIADLFCGCGTFSFPLAEFATIHCFDADKASLSALARAAANTPRIHPLRTSMRNLFNDPLRHDELAGFDAAIFDPPRSGARAQSVEMAKSDLRKIVAVSCNPASFARDTKILLDGGFTLKKVLPADQFRFSPHMELAALFVR